MRLTMKQLRRFIAIFIIVFSLFTLSPVSAQAGFLTMTGNSGFLLASLFSATSPDATLTPVENNDQISESESQSFSKYIYGNSLLSIHSPLAVQKNIQVKVSVKKQYNVTATAYSSTPDQTDNTPFITASGTHVRDGIVAANFLPIGTLIIIPEVYGDKVFIVEDRMHERYSSRVDIWFPSRSEAKQFGVKQITIELI